MALIECPECGREKVSSTASSCPSCGFDIKAWYAKAEEEKLNKMREEQQIRKIEEENKSLSEMYESRVKKTQARIDIPQHRPVLNFDLICGVVGAVLIIGMPIWFYITTETLLLDGMFVIISVFVLCISALSISTGIKKLRKSRELYDTYHNDTKKYARILAENAVIKEMKSEEIKKRIAAQREQERLEEEKRIASIKCPNCGSKNYKKISVTSKVVSTELLGVASPSIGKTFECKTCGYRW